MTTRDTLLTTTEDLVRTRGLNGFSYADLSKRIGIRKASIHHHFPKKADLALATLRAYSEGIFARLDEIANMKEGAEAKLGAYLALYRAALGAGDQTCLCVAYALDRAALSPPVELALAEFHARSLDWLAEVLAPVVAEPKAAAAEVLALVEGAQILARATGKIELFDEAVGPLKARYKVKG